MKGIVLILSIIFVAALLNLESISSITLSLVAIYVLYSLFDRRASVADLSSESNALISKTPIVDTSYKQERVVNDMVSNFGKVTSALIQGKEADISGKAILESSKKIANDVYSVSSSSK